MLAECKKASPSKGVLRNGYDPVELATAYAANGASAISVLTDIKFFQGKIEDLVAVRQAVKIPVLRKDFIFDSYQLIEARAAGADAILLIAALLKGNLLRELRLEAEALGMQTLVEVHDEDEVSHALESGATIIGVNNRDLRYFDVDFETTARLRPYIPATCILVSESGINTPDDVRRLVEMGADAMLVRGAADQSQRYRGTGKRNWWRRGSNMRLKPHADPVSLLKLAIKTKNGVTDSYTSVRIYPHRNRDDGTTR